MQNNYYPPPNQPNNQYANHRPQPPHPNQPKAPATHKRTMSIPAIPAEFNLAGQISFIDMINILPLPGVNLFANASSDLYLDEDQKLKTPSGQTLFSGSINPRICDNVESTMKAIEIARNTDLAPVKLLRATLPNDITWKNPKLHADGSHTIMNDPVTRRINEKMASLKLEEKGGNDFEALKPQNSQVFFPKYRKTKPRSKKGLEAAMQNQHLIGDPALLAPRTSITLRNNPQLNKHLEQSQTQAPASAPINAATQSNQIEINSMNLNPMEVEPNLVSPAAGQLIQPTFNESTSSFDQPVKRTQKHDVKDVINQIVQSSNETTPHSSINNTPI